MQAGNYHQSGGFDPGLLALLGTLISGGIGGYGYSINKKDELENAKNSLDSTQKQIVAAAESALARKTAEAEKNAKASVQVGVLTRERDALKAQLEALKGKVESASGPALTFKTATPAALKAAIPKVLQTLGARYPHLTTKAGTAMIVAALEYPTTYQAKLEGLTLPMFYAKRLQVVFQQIANKKGGRRYRRRGGGMFGPTPGKESNTTGEAAQLIPAKKTLLEVDAKSNSASYGATEEPWPDMWEGLAPGAPATPPPPAAPGAKGIPSYEEFASMYEEAIRNSFVSAKDAVDKRSADAKSAVDTKVQAKKDAAAKKAAGVLAEKLQKVIKPAEADIAKQQTIVPFLAPVRRATLQTLKEALEARIRGASAKAAALTTLTGVGQWEAQEAPAKEDLTGIPADVKAYVEAVKTAKKDEEKSLTDTGSRALFTMSFTMSVNNPFTAAWNAATDPSKAYTESQKAAEFRKRSEEAIKFIRKIYESVEPTLKELEKAKKRRKGGAPRRGTRQMETSTAEEKCASVIQQAPLYINGDADFLIKSLRAVAMGGKEPIDETEWVNEKVDDQTSGATKKSSLKYLLSRLNTGMFASTTDYLRGLMAKQVTYDPNDAGLAGEAYVLLRCYLEKAAEVVKTLKGSETVFQDLSSTLSESRMASAEVEVARKNIDEVIEAKAKEIADREEEIKDTSVAVMKEESKTKGPRDETRALLSVQKDLTDASGLLSGLRSSPAYEALESSSSLLDGKTAEDIKAARDEFEERTETYDSQATAVLAKVDELVASANQFLKLRPQKPESRASSVTSVNSEIGTFSSFGSNPRSVDTTPRAEGPAAPAAQVTVGEAAQTALGMYQPNPLRTNQVLSSTASRRRMLPGLGGGNTTKRRHSKARKSTLKKRRGGK